VFTDFNTAHNTLIQASERDDLGVEVKVEEVAILSPCFMAQKDLDAGAVSEDQIIWGDTTWASGHYAISPDNATELSAFTLLDELVDYFTDRDTFPNLNVIIFSLSLYQFVSAHFRLLLSRDTL
jgi:hypothetical protein